MAISIDLVELIVEFDARRGLRPRQVEDASYGFFFWQLAVQRHLTALTLVDRDEDLFAVDPKCCNEETHPGKVLRRFIGC